MRLDEWQKFIESEFLDAEPPKPAPKTEEESTDVEPTLQTEMFEVPPPALESKPAAPPRSLWNLNAKSDDVPAFLKREPTPEPKPSPPLAPLQKRMEFAPEKPSAPRQTPKTRAPHVKNVKPQEAESHLPVPNLWTQIPNHVETLIGLGQRAEEEVAQHSYKRPFEEKRLELIERILNPTLSLEDTARLLNVCPTTVRRYTNKGVLTCYRKEPESVTQDPKNAGKETRQRRFRLSDILAFLEAQQSTIAADQQADAHKLSTEPGNSPQEGEQ